MNHNCPKCDPPVKVIYQPSHVQYWGQKCGSTFSRREVALIVGGKV